MEVRAYFLLVVMTYKRDQPVWWCFYFSRIYLFLCRLSRRQLDLTRVGILGRWVCRGREKEETGVCAREELEWVEKERVEWLENFILEIKIQTGFSSCSRVVVLKVWWLASWGFLRAVRKLHSNTKTLLVFFSVCKTNS